MTVHFATLRWRITENVGKIDSKNWTNQLVVRGRELQENRFVKGTILHIQLFFLKKQNYRFESV